MDPQTAEQKAKQQEEWKQSDPFALVNSVREGMHDIPEDYRAAIEGPLNELTSRFELQTRAALGSGAVVGSPTN